MNSAGMSSLSKATFTSRATPLAFQFKMPSDTKQYGQAFTMQEKMGVPVPGLFRAFSTNVYHVNTAKTIGGLFEGYIDGITGAIGGAVDKWSKIAVITNVQVNAINGMLTPGGLKGPPLFPLIMASAPLRTPMEQKYSKAIAQAVSDAWNQWANGYMCSLLYPPTFAVCPSPIHPPTPNVPLPIIAGSSPGDAAMQGAALSGVMTGNLGDPRALHHKTLFDSLGTGISTMFLAWKAQTMIMNVLGTGPVPTFAPPIVPMGPVVGGIGNGPPGCLVGPGSGGASPAGGGTPEQQMARVQEMAKQATADAADLALQVQAATFDANTAALFGAGPFGPGGAGGPGGRGIESRYGEQYSRDYFGERGGDKWNRQWGDQDEPRKGGKYDASVGMDVWSKKGDAAAWDAKTKFKNGEASIAAGFGEAGANVKGKFGRDGIEGSAGADVRVSALHAEGRYSVGGFKGKGSADVGTAKAGGKVGVGLSKNNIGANAEGEAGAYAAEASGSVSKKVGGAEASVGGTASVGLGIGGKANAGIRNDGGRRKVEVKVGAKLVAGIGGKVEIGVSVPLPKVSDAKKVVGAIGGLFD